MDLESTSIFFFVGLPTGSIFMLLCVLCNIIIFFLTSPAPTVYWNLFFFFSSSIYQCVNTVLSSPIKYQVFYAQLIKI